MALPRCTPTNHQTTTTPPPLPPYRQVPIAHAEEVEQVFDAISYCKGAAVVRMLHAVLGEADFRRGLQLYMNRHQVRRVVVGWLVEVA